MKRLLVIAALVTLFSVDAGASLIPTQRDSGGMDVPVSLVQFTVPAGESGPQRVKVHYENVNSMIKVDYSVAITTTTSLASIGGQDSVSLNWLSVDFISPATKFTTDNEIDVSVNTAGLSAGSNQTLEIQFIAFSSVLGTLNVNLTVEEALPRTAGASRTSIDETVAPGEKKDVEFEITSDIDTTPQGGSDKGIPSFAVGEVNWTAEVTLLNAPGDNWFTISPTSGTATPDNPSQVTATVDATKLPGPGTYQAEIAVTSNPTVILPVTGDSGRPGARPQVRGEPERIPVSKRQ